MKNKEMKNAYNGFISRLHTAEERIHEPEDKSTEVTQTENKEKNVRGGKTHRASKTCRTISSG